MNICISLQQAEVDKNFMKLIIMGDETCLSVQCEIEVAVFTGMFMIIPKTTKSATEKTECEDYYHFL
jgi:hypothetical protein